MRDPTCYVSTQSDAAGEVVAVDTETKRITARTVVGKDPERLIVVESPPR